ncbi:structural maintenance of chromosomes protein 4-like [Anoplophora glabripennis]|uniref:structural maintenance of chromosomes protein 4-like n=1 Tax=Anoplophora glabripennis TaxID=217634 RepID=UPI0008750E02|nr:structural maintenance of chromosomes protein 4-like [Anoplophora glabripennis]
MTEEVLLAKEIEALKDQITNLKAAINALQEDTEKKEVAIARLAREKEKLHLDLLKQKRSNNSLAKQLKDEREFYFKEKEIYCQEMNECKKIKRLISSSSLAGDDKTVAECKSEIMKLKQTLNQTLEANYNLSIKFLRMKNTKTCLKTEFKTMKLEHEKLENDYKMKIENLTSELNDLVNEKLHSSISPSSKKYLQLVKQNGCLVYENLCLQLEVDNLNLKFEKLKLERTRSETNSRLKYIHHEIPTKRNERPDKKKLHKDPKRVRIQDETPEKLEKEPRPSCSGIQSSKNEKVIKIFERKQTAGVPEIKILNEKETKTKKAKKKSQSNINSRNKEKTTKENGNGDLRNPFPQIGPVLENYEIKIDEKYMQSSAASSVSVAPSLTRSQSSPDIVQGTSFYKTNIK